MSKHSNLSRFLQAQDRDYETALTEIKSGRKRSHWMWYIFPQIQGLGLSSTSQYYAITGIEEAEAFLQHPILGSRLVEICSALLELPSNKANEIFGSPDDLKLKSSMTLFSVLPGSNEVFRKILNKFFSGTKDEKTISIINNGS